MLEIRYCWAFEQPSAIIHALYTEFLITKSKNIDMRKNESRVLCRYASLKSRLAKSSNFSDPTPHHPHQRTQTCNIQLNLCSTQLFLRKKSADRGNSSFQIQHPYHFHLRTATTRRNDYPIDQQKQKQAQLYTSLYKLKHAHLRTEATAAQKDRFMRKLGQTTNGNEFKAVGYDFDPQCCSLLFEYLRTTKAITKIILDNNPLGDEGILKLTELVHQIDLEELSLVSVGMGNKGAAALFTGLWIKCTIRKLNISSMECTFKNKVTAEGVSNLKELLNTKECLLTALHMDYVSLGNQGLKCAFQGIQSSPLEELTLSRNELTSKRMSIFTNGLANTSLLKLDLSRNNIGNQGCKNISEMLGLSYGKNRISVNLMYLNLNNNNINSIGLQGFCRDMCINQTLQTLILDNNPLSEGDRFFNIKYYLTKSWSLRKLSLVKISCSEKDVKFLAEGIEANRALQQLDLSKNQIDCQSFSSLFLMLSRNKTIKRLKLNTCKISDNYLIRNEFQITGSSCPHIEQIQLQNSYIGNKGAEILQKFIFSNPNMLRLNLSRNCCGEKLLLSINETLQENQRKRPFDTEFKQLQSMANIYEQKKQGLKSQIYKNKHREDYLKKLIVVGDIRSRQILEDNLNLQIKNEKRSIKRIRRKRRGSKVAKTKLTEPNDENLHFLTALSNHSQQVPHPCPFLSPQVSIQI